MNHEINWDDPTAVEAALNAEGLGDIDNEINASNDVHVGVGRVGMTGAAGSEQDQADLQEDLDDDAFNLEDFLS